MIAKNRGNEVILEMVEALKNKDFDFPRADKVKGRDVTQELYVRAGSRIRELRESRGYTREQISEIAEISPKFYMK